ncbi:TBC1 domain family member 10A [Fasciola gigantica]|uniref:TBC1 domain family member 10A n=1 Tax=Fasciola gigantica TaxID=46835 RepID=A0A504Y7K8_FASGI|nr:TBC1 domain family member 10A [Fasciola gigantica]
MKKFSEMEVDNDDEVSDEVAELSGAVQYDRYGFSGGKEYTDPDEEPRLPTKVIRAREMKWRDMCNHWEFWAIRNRFKLRERCRKGIPDSMRCEAWQRLCSSPMVLVPRVKVVTEVSQDTRKQNLLKGIFGTLSRNANSKSLPTVITTSPSFRIKRGKADARRKFLFRKLYGNTNPLTVPPLPFPGSEANSRSASPSPCYTDLRLDESSSTRIVDSSEMDLNVPNPSTASEADTASAVFSWPHTKSNGDSTRIGTNRHRSNVVSGSFHNLIYTGCGMDPVVSQSHMGTFSIFTAAVSVHENSCSPVPAINLTTAESDQTAVASSSGGYASLSTNSGTDSVSIPRSTRKPVPPGNVSTDSCASSLTSSSVASSLSILWHPTQSADLPISHHQSTADIEDARATLVPTGDPDPVELYTYYSSQEGTPANCDQIRRDIDRQFPFHELFSQKGGHGQESLYSILKAYTIRHADKGYCQGQAPLAAVLLMFMPEVDAFWTFNEVCERYLEAYYDDGLERIQIDGEILYALLKRIHPQIYKLLRQNSVQPIMIVLEWFMCVYARTLPWATVLRLLDMFFCEGKVVLFRVAIVLLHRLFGSQSVRKACTSMDDVMERLRDVQSAIKGPDEFVRDTIRVNLSPRDIAQEAIRQSHRWERNKQLSLIGPTTTV